MNNVCPICNNDAPLRLSRGVVDYYQCLSCQTLFSDALDNDNKIGGQYEVERNERQNHLRIGRIDELSIGLKKDSVHILDFGCGHGYFINDLKANGYNNVDGYDAYNEPFQKLPQRNKYHIITAVEVIEHTSRPYVEIDVMYRALLPNGVVMIETSFVDVAAEDNIRLEDFFYVSPEAGHSTIFSHHGLDLLFAIKGFIPVQHFDRNVRLYKKKILV